MDLYLTVVEFSKAKFPTKASPDSVLDEDFKIASMETLDSKV